MENQKNCHTPILLMWHETHSKIRNQAFNVNMLMSKHTKEN